MKPSPAHPFGASWLWHEEARKGEEMMEVAIVLVMVRMTTEVVVVVVLL